MFCQHIFTTKKMQATLTKVFFVFVFCFVKHKFVKISYPHNVTCFHQLQATNPPSFQIFDLKRNWRSQPFFVTKHVNANIILA